MAPFSGGVFLYKEACPLALPKKLTRSLLRATCDKTDLNRRILLYRRRFLEVHKLLNGDGKDGQKEK